jgi:hypothetical protein
MYQVVADGKLVGTYDYFFDAWFVAKEMPIWCLIKSKDDAWIVQPWNMN